MVTVFWTAPEMMTLHHSSDNKPSCKCRFSNYASYTSYSGNNLWHSIYVVERLNAKPKFNLTGVNQLRLTGWGNMIVVLSDLVSAPPHLTSQRLLPLKTCWSIRPLPSSSQVLVVSGKLYYATSWVIKNVLSVRTKYGRCTEQIINQPSWSMKHIRL